MKSPNPQIAIAGRSNVGKSTLLNHLLHGIGDPFGEKQRYMSEGKKLKKPTAAPVSAKPGRTRHLFRFEIGGRLTLVDLPGYGFAAVPDALREEWRDLVDKYVKKATRLERVISLVDAVHGVR